ERATTGSCRGRLLSGSTSWRGTRACSRRGTWRTASSGVRRTTRYQAPRLKPQLKSALSRAHWPGSGWDRVMWHKVRVEGGTVNQRRAQREPGGGTIRNAGADVECSYDALFACPARARAGRITSASHARAATCHRPSRPDRRMVPTLSEYHGSPRPGREMYPGDDEAAGPYP